MRLLPPRAGDHRVPRITSARVLAALFNLVVGLRLLWPDDILDNPLALGYRLLLRHFRGDVPLGLLLLLTGAAMTAALYTDRGHRWVGAATWLSLATWLVVALDIALVTFAQIGTLVYVLVAALNGWAYAHHQEWIDQLHRDLR